jgi:hypothetical protein
MASKLQIMASLSSHPFSSTSAWGKAEAPKIALFII